MLIPFWAHSMSVLTTGQTERGVVESLKADWAIHSLDAVAVVATKPNEQRVASTEAIYTTRRPLLPNGRYTRNLSHTSSEDGAS